MNDIVPDEEISPMGPRLRPAVRPRPPMDTGEAAICAEIERKAAAGKRDHARWGKHRHQKAMKLVRAETVRFHEAKRRAAKLQRTPPWADMKAIRTIYDEAARITRATGIPHHVDHEIPLQGELVSGLHVHYNLQILTGPENSKKHNHFKVEV